MMRENNTGGEEDMKSMGPYNVTTHEFGPYRTNIRIGFGGHFGEYVEAMTPEMVSTLQRITNLVKKNSSYIVRWDMVPMDCWSLPEGGWERLKPGNLPLFELESAPGVVLPIELGRASCSTLLDRMMYMLRQMPIKGILQIEERDTSLYEALSRDLDVPRFTKWEDVPKNPEMSIYVSPTPKEAEGHKDQAMVVDPFFPKSGIFHLTRGKTVSDIDVDYLQAIEMLQPQGEGFAIKPERGARCQDVQFRFPRSVGTPSSWQQIAAMKGKGPFVIQPFYRPRKNQGWNEIWRIYLGRLQLSKGFKVIGGAAFARPHETVHGASDSVCWPVMPQS